jgi:regulator of cell morphogenesis and NO signaling
MDPATLPVDLASRPIGEIAATLPGATSIFRRQKLDFCCGGGATLADAAARRGVALERLIRELADLSPSEPDAIASAETPQLIAHIVARYHATHRRELPELVRLARRVEVAHRNHAAVPAGVSGLLESLAGALEVHQKKEELVLFPLMLAGKAEAIAEPIARMRAEHDDAGAELARISMLTGDMTAPADACPTWRALCAGLAKFRDDLTEHVHLENNVLFARFAAEPVVAAHRTVA